MGQVDAEQTSQPRVGAVALEQLAGEVPSMVLLGLEEAPAEVDREVQSC